MGVGEARGNQITTQAECAGELRGSPSLLQVSIKGKSAGFSSK
jgi:hypothetical protein